MTGILGTAPLLRWHIATPAPEEEVAALVTELGVPHALAALLAQRGFSSSEAARSFLRVDSGRSALGEFAISYADQDADKWKGHGQQKQEQWNLKWVKAIGDSRLSAFVNTSRRKEVDYQDLSLDLIKRRGDTLDNFYPDFAAAVNAAVSLAA